MDAQVTEQLADITARLERIEKQVKQTKSYIWWQMMIQILLVVLPIIFVAIMVPIVMSQLGSLTGGITGQVNTEGLIENLQELERMAQ